MRFRLTTVVMFSAAAQAPGQVPEARVRIEPVAAAPAIAVGCLWRHDGDARRFAEAVVVAHCRAEHLRRQIPRAIVAVHADHAVACVVGVLPAAAQVSAATMLAAIVDASALDDDTIVRVQARVALAADDFACLVPAGVLTAAALQRTTLGTGRLADARTMLELPVSRVRELLGVVPLDAVHVRGCVPVDLRQAVLALPLAKVPAAVGDADGLQPGRGEQVHTRVDQPFVMAAFPVVDHASREALLVGLEVARERAALRLSLRGSELRARTPFVAFAPQAGETLVRFFRRGEDYLELLPGEVAAADAAAECAATTAELEGLLADLRTRPPDESELSNARTHAVLETGLSPPTAAGCEPSVLGGKLLTAMSSRHRGLDASAMEAVTGAQAHAALQRLLDPARAYWHCLLPAAQRDRGWRRR